MFVFVVELVERGKLEGGMAVARFLWLVFEVVMLVRVFEVFVERHCGREWPDIVGRYHALEYERADSD